MTADRPIVEAYGLAPGEATGRLVYHAANRTGARGPRDQAEHDVERELALFDGAVATPRGGDTP